MKKTRQLLLLCAVLLLVSCEYSGEDKVKEIGKDGSVEIQISVSHFNDSLDILKIEKKTWIKNKMVTQSTDCDTIHGLGTTKEQAENSEGKDTTVSLRKNYEIFITVQ